MKSWFKYLAVILALGLFAFFIFLYVMTNASFQQKISRIHNWDGRKYCVDMSMRSEDNDPTKLFNACQKTFNDEFYLPEYQR